MNQNCDRMETDEKITLQNFLLSSVYSKWQLVEHLTFWYFIGTFQINQYMLYLWVKSGDVSYNVNVFIFENYPNEVLRTDIHIKSNGFIM